MTEKDAAALPEDEVVRPRRATKLVHPRTGEQLPPLLSTKQTAEILGQHVNTVLAHCALGLISTMPRVGTAPWRIVTAKLLRSLGLDPEESTTQPKTSTGATVSVDVFPTVTAEPAVETVQLRNTPTAGDARGNERTTTLS